MLRFGIIGTNFISEWFVAACRRSGRVVPEAVYSRSLARGEEFAARMGLARAFDDLAAMIEAVDAVYVASPNYAHADQAMQARAIARRNTNADFHQAITMLQQALKLDPDYAYAWSVLAITEISRGVEYLQGAAQQQAYAEARKAAGDLLKKKR